jgi:probable HAF family extracellular repeat protein
MAINDRGEVVGMSHGPHAIRGFVWREGAVQELSSLPGANETVAYRINEAGVVVGDSGTDVSHVRAVRWDSGTITELGTLPGDEHSTAVGINATGAIVGRSYRILPSGDQPSRAVLWDDGGVTDLGGLGGNFTAASGINNRGQIVGNGLLPTRAGRAWLWQAGRISVLEPLASGSSWAYDINDRGQVVGYSSTQDGKFTAVLWEGGRITDLGTLPGSYGSIARGINNVGQVVGTTYTADGYADRAFLWAAGAMRELGAIPGHQGAVALGINASGRIVGSICRPNPVGVLWDPLWDPGPAAPTFEPLTVTVARPPQIAAVGEGLTFKAAARGGGGGPYTFSWDFGDGTMAEGPNVLHAYDRPGSYSPRVTVTDRSGGVSTTELAPISISSATGQGYDVPLQAAVLPATPWILLAAIVAVATGYAVIRRKRDW